MRPVLRAASAFIVMSLASMAQAATKLPQTDLYTATAHDCRVVDLSAWRHPTRGVLFKAGAKIDKIELCNNEKFPIFTVRLKSDPRSPGNTRAFDRLYIQIAEANDWWPYALVDEIDGVVVNVATEKTTHRIDVSIQDYDPD